MYSAQIAALGFWSCGRKAEDKRTARAVGSLEFIVSPFGRRLALVETVFVFFCFFWKLGGGGVVLFWAKTV